MDSFVPRIVLLVILKVGQWLLLKKRAYQSYYLGLGCLLSSSIRYSFPLDQRLEGTAAVPQLGGDLPSASHRGLRGSLLRHLQGRETRGTQRPAFKSSTERTEFSELDVRP